MKNLTGAFLLLLTIKAHASDCTASLISETAHGRGPTLQVGHFNTDTEKLTLGNYEFVLSTSTHGESQILAVDMINPIKTIFKEQNNIPRNSKDIRWVVDINVADTQITVSCKW